MVGPPDYGTHVYNQFDYTYIIVVQILNTNNLDGILCTKSE